tara:strand:+ start:931 stop:2409 length:1479 start_codon:yes stop_codon:yes gene_type:complete
MKLSIITVCFNSEKTISDTINSVNSQTYKNIEHIFVDGGSTDKTLTLIKNNPNKKKKVLVRKKSSIYKAMNEGIKEASGSVIQILNSDDVFYSNTTIEKVISEINKNPNFDLYLGNVVYFSLNNFYKVKRYFVANKNKIFNLIYGEMPPHPASFIKKDVYKKLGLYDTRFKIASDFDYFFRTIVVHKKKFKILNQDIIKMREGGASDKYIKSYIVTTKEIINSIKKYSYKVNKTKIILRAFNKIQELFLFNERKINKNFELFKFDFDKKKYENNSFSIFRSIKLLNFKKNFILSGMNLAFLGYFSKNSVYPHKDLYHWPDGIFTKRVIDINKIPGRKILDKIKIPKKIKTINIIGNISIRSKKFIRKKFNKKIIHTPLPYAPMSELKKLNIELKPNELTFITLPTPKQEQLAFLLAKKNKIFKIICIGGSIAIASGEEKPVPNFLSNYEFLWRLKNDFMRRSFRLIESLYYFAIGGLTKNLYNKTIFKIIEK